MEHSAYHFESNFPSDNNVNQIGDEKSKEFSESEEEAELESKMEESDTQSTKEHTNFLEEDTLGRKKFIGSLSDELANIGHIDSSETSDDSPEGMI